jgi:hypothetical protein
VPWAALSAAAEVTQADSGRVAQHRGYALVACPGLQAAQELASALHGAEWAEGVPLKTGPAAKVPTNWPEDLSRALPELTNPQSVFQSTHSTPSLCLWSQHVLAGADSTPACDRCRLSFASALLRAHSSPCTGLPEDLASEEALRAGKTERQQHRRRQRERWQARHIAELGALLATLPPPGGLGAIDVRHAAIAPEVRPRSTCEAYGAPAAKLPYCKISVVCDAADSAWLATCRLSCTTQACWRRSSRRMHAVWGRVAHTGA